MPTKITITKVNERLYDGGRWAARRLCQGSRSSRAPTAPHAPGHNRHCAWAAVRVLGAVALASVTLVQPSGAKVVSRSAITIANQSPVETIMLELRSAQHAAVRAAEAGDPEAVHESEATIGEALQLLMGHTSSLPESSREPARKLIDLCSQIVGALHEAALAGDMSAVEQLVRELGSLIAEIRTTFRSVNPDGAQA